MSEEFRNFYKPTEDLHEAIRSKDHKKVEELLRSNKDNLSYFFSLSNESAVKVAIDSRAFDIYETLLIHGVLYAPHDISNKIFQRLKYRYQQIIRDIHTKHSKSHPDNYINILMTMSYLSHDGTSVVENLKYVEAAYKHMSKNTLSDYVLRTVAAAGGIEFIYDFNRDAVDIADPTNSPYTEGVFYPSGKIYIGAKLLLDEETFLEAVGVIAHEMTHCAVNLVYENQARPYLATDHQRMQEFEEINVKCKALKEQEDIVDIVYECYDPGMHHAELVVRVTHMLMLYSKQPEVLAQKMEIFKELFDYVQQYVLEDMKNAIPVLKRKARLANAKKDRKISRLKGYLCIIGVLSVIGLIVAVLLSRFIFTKTIYEFKNLSKDEKDVVRNGAVTYKNTPIKLRDLYANDSIAYDKLTSDHLHDIFDGNSLNFSDPHLSYLDNLVVHHWWNLTDSLKEKFLNYNFTFQEQSLKFSKLYNFIPKAFDHLTSNQITDVLDGKTLTVGTMVKESTDFYIERHFIFEGQAEALKASFFLNTAENIDTVIEKTNRNRLFILSSEAGAGKSVTFEQLTRRIKQKYPTKWVSYIELKDFTAYYNASGIYDSNLFSKILNFSPSNWLEYAIYYELFEAGEVVFLFNGLDEVSPTYTEFIIRVIFNNLWFSKNVQYVSTRPMYSKTLQDSLNFHPYQLVPFTEEQKTEFLYKYFVSKNVEEVSIDGYIEKVQNISIRMNFTTPLMLKLIAEVHENQELFESENLYKIYEIFVKKKIDIWQKKSELASNITSWFLSGNSAIFDIRKIYQKLGIHSELKDFIIINGLEIVSRCKCHNVVPAEEISRMGILYILDNMKYEFVHKTFAEFFVAQYFIENFYLFNSDKEFDGIQADLFLELRTKEGVCRFLTSYLQFQPEKNFSTAVKEHIDMEIFTKFLYGGTIPAFEMLFNLFGKDRKLLVELLRVDQADTFYIRSFDFLYDFIGNPKSILELAKNYLAEDELDRFIKGRDQKGIVMLGITYARIQAIEQEHEIYTIGNDTPSFSRVQDFFSTIKGNLTESEQKELIKFQLSSPNMFVITESSGFDTYKNLWHQSDQFLNKSEQIEAIKRALTTDEIPLPYVRKIRLVNNIILEKVQEIMTDEEIFYLFKDQKLLHRSASQQVFFEQFWNVFLNHTNYSQQREILLLSDTFGKVFNSNSGLNGNLMVHFDRTPYQVFHFSTFVSSSQGGSFPIVSMIYERYFNQTEMRDLLMKSNIFHPRIYTYLDTVSLTLYSFYEFKMFKQRKDLYDQFEENQLSWYADQPKFKTEEDFFKIIT